MKIEQTAHLDAPRARVWSLLMDVPRVARCVPGVQEVEQVGDDQYRGALQVRVGPISLLLRGDIHVVARDEEAGTADMAVDASDKRVGGAVKATMHMVLTDSNGAGTSSDLQIVTDAQVMGKIGEFGQPVIRRKADQIMREFADNVRRSVASPDQA